MDVHRQLQHRRRRARHHSGEEPVAVEPPPVPLQHVGRDERRDQRRDDPFGHLVHIRRRQAEHDAQQHHRARRDPGQPHLPPRRRLRVQVAFINIVDHVSRARIHRRDERAHERRQQRRDQDSFQPYRHVFV